MNSVNSRAVIAAFILMLVGSHAFAAPKRCVAGSLDHLLASREGRPVMLVFWSIECATCIKELTLLSKMVRQHSQLDVVMISTDMINQAEPVESVLSQHLLEGVESWIFADSNTQRLRYEIDPEWFGELPRCYFYDADRQRIAVSGMLEQQHFDAWLKMIH